MSNQYNILPLALGGDYYVLARAGLLIPPLKKRGTSVDVGRFSVRTDIRGGFLDETIYADIGRFSTLSTFRFVRHVDIAGYNIGRFEVLSGLKFGLFSQSNIGIPRSWLRNGHNYLYAILSEVTGDESGQFGAGYMSAKTVLGSVRSAKRTHATDYYSSHQFSIEIGSSDQAFSPEANTLVSKILTMDYAPVDISGPFYHKGIWSFRVTGAFTNGDVSVQTIKEVGLRKNVFLFHDSTQGLLVTRDVLPIPIFVALSATVYVVYELVFDFRGIDNV